MYPTPPPIREAAIARAFRLASSPVNAPRIALCCGVNPTPGVSKEDDAASTLAHCCALSVEDAEGAHSLNACSSPLGLVGAAIKYEPNAGVNPRLA